MFGTLFRRSKPAGQGRIPDGRAVYAIGDIHGRLDLLNDLLRRTGTRPGHIFNLGHGILPETPVENVKAVVQIVRDFRP